MTTTDRLTDAPLLVTLPRVLKSEAETLAALCRAGAGPIHIRKPESSAAEVEGLHPLLVQAHDGKTVEAEHTAAGLFHPAHVGTAGNGAVKVRTDLLLRQGGGIKTDDSAHKKHLQIK